MGRGWIRSFCGCNGEYVMKLYCTVLCVCGNWHNSLNLCSFLACWIAVQGLLAYVYDYLLYDSWVELNQCRFNHIGMDVLYRNPPSFQKKHKKVGTSSECCSDADCDCSFSFSQTRGSLQHHRRENVGTIESTVKTA